MRSNFAPLFVRILEAACFIGLQAILRKPLTLNTRVLLISPQSKVEQLIWPHACMHALLMELHGGPDLESTYYVIT